MGADMKPLKSSLQNQRGLAMIESIPLLVIFVVLLSFGVGMYAAIHTATLHSIGSRTYAFETFRQRTNLNYFREDISGLRVADSRTYAKFGWRYHAVQSESDSRNEFVPSARRISINREVAAEAGSRTQDVHNSQIYSLNARNERVSVNPIWIMVGYGICMNASCGN